MKKILLLMCAVVVAWGSYAQTTTVSGTVTSAEEGTVIPGVNVLLKGTSNGTVTDAEGKYSLAVPPTGGVLVFSFIGLKAQEIEISGRATIDIALALDATELSEVVVSALGVERNSRDIVYANQTVSSEDLLSSPNKNTLEALRGKTAGVRLSTGSGSVGASTRIVLRAEGSLTGNNNALIVVDGIPINNETTTGGPGVSTTGYADHGNRFNDINPDDIESLTILKGPSATSLYGSRGASGVVLITTKKGKRDGKMDISLNSTYSREKAIIMLERQDRFGQGYDNAHFDTGENWAWGPAFDGVVRPWTSAIDADGDGALESLLRPYSAVPDQLQEFFNIGSTFTNSINFSGSAGNNFTYYASYSNTDQKGILDNTWYKRNTLTFNGSAKLSQKFRTDFKLTYANVKQNTAQEGSRPFEGNNAYAMVIQSPNNIPFGELRDYKSPFHDPVKGYWGSYSSVNPYYILNEYGNRGRINNILANTSATYSVMEGLDITGRFGANVITTTIDTWTPVFTPELQYIWADGLVLTPRTGRHESLGEYVNFFKTNANLDLSVMANYTRALTSDLKLDISAGYNWFQTEREELTGSTIGGLVVEGVYNLSNSAQTPRSDQLRNKYRIFGALGNARLGYKDALFLELSARNDWSSTLPAGKNSFFYSAVGASAIISDLFEIENEVLSFAKLRTSFGTTGKDAGLYLLSTDFIGNPEIAGLGDYTIAFPLNGLPGFTTSNRIGQPNLEPETTTTFEIGADVGFFDERINLSYTYYSANHANQIVLINLPASSGYTNTVSNVGEMTNKGHEITLNVRPIQGLVDGLNLELFATYSRNKNEVVKIADGIDELFVGGPFTGVSIVAKEGMPFGTFKGLAPQRNEDGQVVVDATTGMPLYTEEEVYLGSYQPDFTAGFGMNASYKGFGFNILFDVRKGGEFVSQTKFHSEFNGTAANTVAYNREPFIFPNAVYYDETNDVFVENDIEITEQDYYTNYDIAASEYLVDASYVKLRELGISYTVPRSILSKTPFKSARLSVFGKNLKFWVPGENIWADPEINGPALTGNAQGIETSQTPPSRSFGVNLQLTF